MTGTQITVIAAFLGFFLLLYFGFDNKPEAYHLIEKTRGLMVEASDPNTILQNAMEVITDEQKNTIRRSEQLIASAPDDSTKLSLLKDLSGYCYQIDQRAAAGIYANQIANMVDDDNAWSIAGSTFVAAVQQEKDETVKTYCNDKAIEAFENAISLNPKEVQHKVNLALRYVERPPNGQPMKGILDLRDLSEKYPDNIMVLNNLGQLSIRTGQWDKAQKRFEKVLALDPDNLKANCWMVEVFEGINDMAKAATFRSRCESLSNAQ